MGLGAFANVSTTGLLGNTLALSNFSLPDVDKLKGFISSTKGEKAIKMATGGVVTPRTAGIFELHQGEMVLDNAAVAAFSNTWQTANSEEQV